jgi:ornithine cyclodeaminase
MSLLLLNQDELRQIITIGEAIEAVENTFVALAENRLNAPANFILDLPDVKGQVEIGAAYLSEAPFYVVKVRSNFHDNPTLNLPAQSGLITVFDATTGFPTAILIDNGYLSMLRAGATGALAARYLANPTIDQVAVIGTGNQAYIQLKCLMAVRRIRRVLVWGRSAEQADSYARRLVEDHDLNIEIAPSVEAAVRQADLVITATASQVPLVKADWLKPGVHITAVGSNHPHKQELDLDVLQRADVIIVDKYSQCAAAGEIHHALKAGLIAKDNIRGELGDLIIGRVTGRTRPDQITLADLTGLEVQNAAVATLALSKANYLGLGQQVVDQL